jgi:hypothetical protein
MMEAGSSGGFAAALEANRQRNNSVGGIGGSGVRSPRCR